MGKIRRLRQKYHTNIGQTSRDKCINENEKEIELPPAQVAIPSTGLFQGLDINFDNLVSQKLPEFDKISVCSRNSRNKLPEKHLTKKEKRQSRHDAFLKKLEFSKQMIKKEKAAKQRRKIPVVGDMHLLADALPSLELLKKESKKKKNDRKKKESQKKLRSIEKIKTRGKQVVKHISSYRQVIKHPSFKANPYETILDHVQNIVKIEKEKIKNN